MGATSESQKRCGSAGPDVSWGVRSHARRLKVSITETPWPHLSHLDVIDYGRAVFWRAPSVHAARLFGCRQGMPLASLPDTPARDLRRLLRAAMVADAPTIGVYSWSTAAFDGLAWCRAEPGECAVRFARTIALTIVTQSLFAGGEYFRPKELPGVEW